MRRPKRVARLVDDGQQAARDAVAERDEERGAVIAARQALNERHLSLPSLLRVCGRRLLQRSACPSACARGGHGARRVNARGILGPKIEKNKTVKRETVKRRKCYFTIAGFTAGDLAEGDNCSP